jgi:pimeloyl-ACP methyl ester carboxylesterase
MEIMVKSNPVYYEEYGEGIPILMLHGKPIDHHQMVADMEPLFKQRSGWRRIYPDLPGMGKTPGAAWITHIDQVLDLLMAFLQQVAPGQRYVVAGTSFGGYLARGLAYKQGSMIDGLLLVVPAINPDPEKRELPPRQVLVKDAQFLAALTPEEAGFSNMSVVQSMEVLDTIRTVVRPAVQIADQPFLEKLEEHPEFSFPVDQVETPFPAPALILTGRQDFGAGYRDAWTILENFPRATFAVLDRAGHMLGVEQTTLFQALTNEWLDRVEEYVAGSNS